MAEDEQFPAFQSIACGQIDHLPVQASNAVRIFISSTFTDTVEERNKLTKEVFPDLRRYCQGRGVEFEVVDMRWGVRDTATSDHLTSELCLQEIDHCKRISLGPSFVGILGNKYGYRPIPSTLPSDEYETLISVVRKHLTSEEMQLMSDWFRQDTNAVPPVYVLQPITTNLKDYYNEQEPEKRAQDRNLWWEIFQKLRCLLRKAAECAVQEGVYSKKDMHKYHFSVTEEEVRQAIGNGSDDCLFFFRDIQGIEDHLDSPLTPKMLDVTEDGTIDTEAQMHLQNLKTEVIGKGNIHRFSVPWSANGIDPNIEEHSHYLDDFCETFRRSMKEMIDKSLENRTKVQNQTTTQLYGEMLHHASFCAKKCKNSVTQGRQDILNETSNYLSRHTGKPLVVHGVSGSGKTTIMSLIAKDVRQWLGDSAVSIIRFLGTSVNSSSIRETLGSICRQICHAYGVEQPPADILEDFTKLVQHFRHLLDTLPDSKKPLFLLLDSIDQLISQNDAHAMNWLPKNFQKDVHIVVSMLPKLYGCLDKIKETLLDEECYFDTKPLPRETGVEIIHGCLKEKNRTLTDLQLEAVINASQKCPRPIFLKLLCEDCGKWRSYDDVDESQLPYDVRNAITSLFEELERKHGPILVSHALGYLTAAKNGITQMELEDVISCDDEVLNDVYQYWDPPSETVVRIPGSLWKRIYYDIKDSFSERQAGGKTVITWYHRQFWEAAQDRYLSSDVIRKKRHELLAKMFLGEFSEGTIRPVTLHARGKTFDKADRQTSHQPLVFANDVFNLRKLQELSHHLGEASMDDILAEQVLFNFNWLLTKLRAFSFLELMLDFPNTSEKVSDEPTLTSEIDKLHEMMYLASSNIKPEPFTLAGELIGRLSDTRKDFPKINRLLKQAKSWVDTSTMPLMIPRSTCLMPPGGPLRVTLAGHPSRVLKVACTRSSKLLVSACEDSSGHIMANVWDLATWEVIHTIHLNNSVPKLNGHLAMAISSNDRHLILAHRSLGIFDLNSGDCLKKIDIDNSIVLTDIKASDGLIVAGALEQNRVYVWNLDDGNNVLQMELPGTSPVPHVLLRKASSHIVSVRADASVHIIDLETKQIIWECLASTDNPDIVKSAILPLDEQDVITGCSDGVIRIWQLEQDSKEPKVLLKGHKKPVTQLLINSRRQLISGSADGTLRVWDLSSGSPTFTLSGHDGAVTCLTFIHNGDDNDDVIVSGSKDDKLKVWDTSTGTLMNTLEGHSSWISHVTAVNGSQGIRVISACNDKTVKIWLPTLIMPSSLSRHDEGSPRCIAASTSGRYVTTSALKGVTKVWNANDGQCLHDISIESKCLISLPDNDDNVIGGDNQGQIHCWNLATGDEVWSYAAHDNPVTQLCWGDSSLDLVSVGGSEAKLWNLSQPESITSPAVIFAGHDNDITSVGVTKKESSNLMVTACKKGVVKIWSYDTGECCQTLPHNDKIECLAISRNGRFLATGTKTGMVAVWSLESNRIGHQVTSSHLSDDTVVCLVFTKDEKHLICGLFRGKKQLYMWDFQVEGDGSSRYLEGHHHAVQVSRLLANGKYLLTSSRDCTLKIWHVASGKLVTTFDCQSQIKFCDVAEIGEYHWLVAAATKMAIVFLDARVTKQAGPQTTSLAASNGEVITKQRICESEPTSVIGKHDNDHSKQNGESKQYAPKSKTCHLF